MLQSDVLAMLKVSPGIDQFKEQTRNGVFVWGWRENGEESVEQSFLSGLFTRIVYALTQRLLRGEG